MHLSKLTNTSKFCWPITLHKIRITTARELMSAPPSIHVAFVARLLAGEGRRVSDGSATGVPREGANDVELLYFVLYLLHDSDN